MKNKLFFIIFLLITFSNLVYSQRPGQGFGGSATGTVLDSVLQSPLEYATVILYNLSDNQQVNGTITDPEGKFQLKRIRPGSYYIKVSFIGYESITVENFEIGQNNRTLDLGIINLPRVAYQIEEAQVTAEKPAIEYKIDKKVINVDEHYSAITGTAVDVLENVPSITVDIEGNVQLRGSSSFTVLIDGRPSVLDANDALQQVPASVIENIEIITNPSAKFDPEGETGIINIIMKKEQDTGLHGLFNTNAGFDENYGGDFLINYRNSDYSINFGADYNNRNRIGTSLERRQTFINDTTNFNNSTGSSKRGGTRWGLRGGFDFDITQNDLISLSLRYGNRDGNRNSDVEFFESSDPGDFTSYYFSKNISERGGDFYSTNLNYNHKFNNEGHVLKAEAYYNKRDNKEKSINELLDGNKNVTSGRQLTENGPSSRLHFKLDYELPFSKTNKFETGIQSQFNKSEDRNNLYDFDSLQSTFIIQPQFGYQINYNRDIHSVYGIYSGESGSFGYQAGIRSEYTDRNIILADSNSNSTINRWDYFPTLHFSFQQSDIQQVMISYTRRIQRPRGWQLEPFQVWTDEFNIRKGNPDLKPQYIDSYELGYQTFWGNNLISLEGYFRKTHNYIESVRSVFDKNVTLRTFENIGSSSSLGTEFMLNAQPVGFWSFNLLGNLYNYKIDGELLNRKISRDSFNWRVRLNNNIIFDKNTRVQINTSYNSPSASAQGSSEGYFSANIALRKDFFNKMLSATLQIRDVFSSTKRESTIEGFDFSSYSRYTRKAPMVMLNLRFNINNYKNDKERERTQEPADDEGDEF
jgi:outer membrane receptor protein involved in Fe transport